MSEYSKLSAEEKIKAKNRWKRWADKNREHLREYNKKYQKEHPEIHLLASRKYSEKHRKSKTNSELQNTATWIGRRFEVDALKILVGSVDMNRDKMNHPNYDLFWNGLRIDVKGKKLWRKMKRTKTYTRKKWISHIPKGQWTFHSSNLDKIDSVLCLGYDAFGQRLLQVFLIPAEKYSKTGITIMEGSKGKFSNFEIQPYQLVK